MLDTKLLTLRFGAEGSRTLAFEQNHIYRVHVDGTRIRLAELDNNGLDGHGITSLSTFDEKVYVTTRTGVFEKPVTDFFEQGA